MQSTSKSSSSRFSEKSKSGRESLSDPAIKRMIYRASSEVDRFNRKGVRISDEVFDCVRDMINQKMSKIVHHIIVHLNKEKSLIGEKQLHMAAELMGWHIAQGLTMQRTVAKEVFVIDGKRTVQTKKANSGKGLRTITHIKDVPMPKNFDHCNAMPGKHSANKKNRYKPGTVALRMQYHQQDEACVFFSHAGFDRVIKACFVDHYKKMGYTKIDPKRFRFSPGFKRTFQSALEEMCIRNLHIALKAAEHAKRDTLKKSDVEFVMNMHH